MPSEGKSTIPQTGNGPDGLTKRDIAARWGVTPRLVDAWVQDGRWPDPIGIRKTPGKRGPGVKVWDTEQVERAVREVFAPSGWSFADVAAHYGVSQQWVVKEWGKHEAWPEPLGKRHGRVFDPHEVHAAVRRIFGLPVPAGDPKDLLDRRQAMEYLGLAEGTWKSRHARGQLSEPVVGDDGVKRWPREVVEVDHVRLRSKGKVRFRSPR